MSRLELTTFGVPHIRIDGRSVEALSARKAQALLIYLAMTRQQHSRQALAGLLWSDMPETKARQNLRVTLTRMREPLEEHLIIRRRSLLINDASDSWLDAKEFESCLVSATPTLNQLQRAADLYRGHFLNDFALRDAPLFEEWVRPLQERYRQMAMEAIYRLARYHTEQKQYTPAITYANRLLLLEPWMEEAHRQLMLLLALSGQRSAALTQYESCCAMLMEELGVEPAAATVALYEQILREEIQPDAHTVPLEVSAPMRAAPDQIPAAVKHFVGRSGETAALEKALCAEDGPPLHALVGMGGIGKSALAIQLARGLQKAFPDGVLWANAATSEPMAILESWAAAYGYDFTRIADLESMAAAFRGLLAEKRVLIVLDDVTSVSRIRPLLPGGEQCRVLLTTRDQDLARALNAEVWPLRELSTENGRLLLSAILGQNRVAAETEAADEICALLQNLPLALEITAQRLKSRPRRHLTDMARRLRDETQRLSWLKISDREVRVSFVVSWGSLDAERQRVFALIGLFNGRSFAAEAMAHIAEMDSYPMEDRLFDLVNLSLLGEEEGRRYRQHALLGDFAREQLGEDRVGEGYGRFASYYLHFAQQNEHDYNALRPEWDNLMAAMAAAYANHLWQTVIDFADVLHDAWFVRARYGLARMAYRFACEAAEKINDLNSLANNLFLWGCAATEQKDYDEAKELLNRSLQKSEELEEDLYSAKTKILLARIALEQSKYDQALELLQQCHKIYETNNDQTGIAETLFMDARVYYFKGQYDRTIVLANDALALFRNLNDLKGAMLGFSLLASASMNIREFVQAEDYCHKGLVLCEQLHDKGERAVLLGVLAGSLRKQSRFQEAQEYIRESLKLLEYIGDLGAKASALYQLSMVQEGQGKFEESLQTALQSLQLSTQTQYALLTPAILLHVGDLQSILKKDREAIDTWQNALHEAEALQHPLLIQELKQRLA